jgi:streptogramin lyase
MKKSLCISLSLAVSACAAEGEPREDLAGDLSEQAIEAPGFIDFLVVEDTGVWSTNRGRIERWTAQGKQAEIEIPRPCGTMATLDGDLWVANCDDANLYRIDPDTAETVEIINTGIANPRGETNVVAGAGSVWVPSDPDGTIARIDPQTNSVIAEVDVAPGTFFLAFGFGALWAVSSDERLLQRVDPQTNAVTAQVELGRQPGFLAAGEGAVWVQEQKDGTVARIDPETVEVTTRTEVGDTLLYGDIDTGEGKVWLRTTEDQTFVTLDAQTGELIGRYGAPTGSGAIRHTEEAIWTTAHDVERISRWTPAPSGVE